MNPKGRQARAKVVILVTIFFLCCHPPLIATASPLVLILSSHEAQPYATVLDAFKNHLGEQDAGATYEQWFLNGDGAKPTEALKRIKEANPAVVFAIGGAATRTVQRETPDLPIVASLVVSLGEGDEVRNTTGVLLQHSPDTHFQWLTRLCPECRRVGLVYSSTGEDVIKAMSEAAFSLGLELIEEKIAGPKDVPKALERLIKKADILLPLPDEALLRPQIAKAILLTSFRNRVPVIGPSSAWVKAGALYALDWDYEELGQSSAELVSELLHGRPLSEVQPRLPRNVRYSLNLKTAKHMKWTFADNIENGAAEVFK